ncbi:MAG: hypothetical protein K1060chlam5_00008 [Candidatus Anoxychlamydiales bacterium]|nr:hypothetical protein [Candidatus Anoxychlamydiales bacterium]
MTSLRGCLAFQICNQLSSKIYTAFKGYQPCELYDENPKTAEHTNLIESAQALPEETQNLIQHFFNLTIGDFFLGGKLTNDYEMKMFERTVEYVDFQKRKVSTLAHKLASLPESLETAQKIEEWLSHNISKNYNYLFLKIQDFQGNTALQKALLTKNLNSFFAMIKNLTSDEKFKLFKIENNNQQYLLEILFHPELNKPEFLDRKINLLKELSKDQLFELLSNISPEKLNILFPNILLTLGDQALGIIEVLDAHQIYYLLTAKDSKNIPFFLYLTFFSNYLAINMLKKLSKAQIKDLFSIILDADNTTVFMGIIKNARSIELFLEFIYCLDPKDLYEILLTKDKKNQNCIDVLTYKCRFDLTIFVDFINKVFTILPYDKKYDFLKCPYAGLKVSLVYLAFLNMDISETRDFKFAADIIDFLESYPHKNFCELFEKVIKYEEKSFSILHLLAHPDRKLILKKVLKLLNTKDKFELFKIKDEKGNTFLKHAIDNHLNSIVLEELKKMSVEQILELLKTQDAKNQILFYNLLDLDNLDNVELANDIIIHLKKNNIKSYQLFDLLKIQNPRNKWGSEAKNVLHILADNFEQSSLSEIKLLRNLFSCLTNNQIMYLLQAGSDFIEYDIGIKINPYFMGLYTNNQSFISVVNEFIKPIQAKSLLNLHMEDGNVLYLIANDERGEYYKEYTHSILFYLDLVSQLSNFSNEEKYNILTFQNPEDKDTPLHRCFKNNFFVYNEQTKNNDDLDSKTTVDLNMQIFDSILNFANNFSLKQKKDMFSIYNYENETPLYVFMQIVFPTHLKESNIELQKEIIKRLYSFFNEDKDALMDVLSIKNTEKKLRIYNFLRPEIKTYIASLA